MKKNEVLLKLKQNNAQLPNKIVQEKPNEVRSVSGLLTTLEQKLTPRQLKAVQDIGLSLSTVGLSLEDALLRNLISKDELDNLIMYVPELQDYLRLQQVEYKYKLLNIISNQAVEKADVKMASWLLEKQYSEEFDSSVKKDLNKYNRDNEGDMVEMALAFVRRTSANAVPVDVNAGAGAIHQQVKVYDINETLK